MGTCKKCIYDETVGNISFDKYGICNYCNDVSNLKKDYGLGNKIGKNKIIKIFNKIKKEGKNNKYDCVIGVSGGTDSSYLLYLAKKFNLRPLAVHYDNTWNSAIASSNIHKMLSSLNFDLYTYVINNKESDDIFKSFFLSGVSEIEAPTDLALVEVSYRVASKFKIKYILDGHSFVEEGITPLRYNYFDGKYIESIHKKFGELKLKTYPLMTFSNFFKWTVLSGIKRIRPFWYIEYSKNDAKKILKENFNWEDYAGHHQENKMSSFYHSVYLLEKFKTDMSINRLSAQVREGKISREKAENLLNQTRKPNIELVMYFQKRLNLSDNKYNHVMHSPPRFWYEFKTYKKLFERLRFLFKILEKNNLVTTSFYLKYCFPFKENK